MGIDRDPPVWPSIQDDGGYQSASSLWIVECGVGAVVKWSCGVIERCGNMSVSQVLQHNLCILHTCLAFNREIVCFILCTSSHYGKFVSMISLRFVVLFATVHAL